MTSFLPTKCFKPYLLYISAIISISRSATSFNCASVRPAISASDLSPLSLKYSENAFKYSDKTKTREICQNIAGSLQVKLMVTSVLFKPIKFCVTLLLTNERDRCIDDSPGMFLLEIESCCSFFERIDEYLIKYRPNFVILYSYMRLP